MADSENGRPGDVVSHERTTVSSSAGSAPSNDTVPTTVRAPSTTVNVTATRRPDVLLLHRQVAGLLHLCRRCSLSSR